MLQHVHKQILIMSKDTQKYNLDYVNVIFNNIKIQIPLLFSLHIWHMYTCRSLDVYSKYMEEIVHLLIQT